MTIVTLHHLCFGHCFGHWYFSSGAALLQKNTSVQNNHLRFHTMTSKKMVPSNYCLLRLLSPKYYNSYIKRHVFNQKFRRKQHQFWNSVDMCTASTQFGIIINHCTLHPKTLISAVTMLHCHHMVTTTVMM